MANADVVLAQLARIPTVDRMVGVFVAMDDTRAVVNVGDKSVTIPCVGFNPPMPGIAVQLDRVNGFLAVTGPAVTLPAMGTIKATGSPKCTVTLGGNDLVLGYRAGYTPVIGDDVEVNPATLIIQGKVTVAPPAPAGGANPGGGGGAFTGLLALATNSGQFRDRWQSNDVRASDTVSGAWVYGTRIYAAIAGTLVTRIEIYLPLRSSVGACYIGTHGYGVLPAGWVGIGNVSALGARAGWVTIPTGFISALQAGGGIAVTSGSGDNNWAGTQADALSGALRFSGTR